MSSSSIEQTVEEQQAILNQKLAKCKADHGLNGVTTPFDLEFIAAMKEATLLSNGDIKDVGIYEFMLNGNVVHTCNMYEQQPEDLDFDQLTVIFPGINKSITTPNGMGRKVILATLLANSLQVTFEYLTKCNTNECFAMLREAMYNTYSKQEIVA